MVPPGIVKAFVVLLEDEGRAGYTDGDTLQGQVLLELDAELSFKALRLQARGGVRVSWAESRPKTPREEEAEYLDLVHVLKTADADGVITLLAGKHEFPFNFELLHVPLTSFLGKYGSIKYDLVAILDQPSIPVKNARRDFKVINHIDVNSPSLLTPVSRSKEKMVGCWLFATGPVSLSAKIERKGYCNGEAIPIYAEIENYSSRLIVPKAAIFQTQTYLSGGKTKTVRQVLAHVRGNHIASGSTDSWNRKTLKIPPVSPSILNCGLIRVEYSLSVYVHIPGAKKLTIELPLVIGTIPFNESVSRNASVNSHFAMDMSWLALALPDVPEAPPNYADVVSEEEFSRHIPSYPQPSDAALEGEFHCPMYALIQEFRFQPPPLYLEVDPHPCEMEEQRRTVSFII